MTYLHSVRAMGIDPLVIDGGDFLFSMGNYRAKPPEARQLTEKAKIIVDAYNRFGYAAAAVGEADIVLGVDVLRGLQKEMKFPLLCANLVDRTSGAPLFQPSLILSRGGLRIAVIAVMMDSLTQSYLDRVAPTAKVLPPVDTLQAELERLREQADVFFILAQIDRRQVDKIADEFGIIDFVLEPNCTMGSDNIWVGDEEHFIERGGDVLLKVDGQGAHVGKLDLFWKQKGLPWRSVDAPPPAEGAPPAPASAVNLYRGTDVELAPHIGKNAAIEEMIENFRKRTRFVPSGEPSAFTPSAEFLGVDTCQACHPDQYSFWEKSGHAKAYETLEKTGDEFRYDCIPCHVLGYGETFIEATQVEQFKDVQCESCHGTNPNHPSDPKSHPWPQVDDKACWGCHNPKVTRAEFVPEEAIPQIQCPKLQRN